MGRRIVYYVATSADGFLARSDGRVDWLDAHPAADYGFERFLEGIDTIVWGRSTFDQSLGRGGLAPFGGPGVRHLVVSTRPLHHPGVEHVVGDVPSLAQHLRGQPGKDVWIMGGATLAASFLDAGEIDAITLHVIPVLLREGIPLFAAQPRHVPLRLRGSHAYSNGVLRLDYDVERS